MSSSKIVTEPETSCLPHLLSAVDKVVANAGLLTEILLRLPIKSILRFKLVSRRWLTLITDPYFSRRRMPNPTPSGLFLNLSGLEYEFVSLNDDTTTPPFRTLNFAPNPSGITILNSCNGLLCCYSYGNVKYHIYNPTTNQFATLPNPGPRVDGMILAFDPANSPHYKVVCVRSSVVLSNHCQIEIYSSEIGLWRVSGEPFLPGFDKALFDSGVYFNGAIHWVTECDLLYFNVDQELLQPMLAPPIPEDYNQTPEDYVFRYLGESRDHLHLIVTYGPSPFQKFQMHHVYEMERDHSGWSLMYRVDGGSVPSDLGGLDWYGYTLIVVWLVRGETEADSFLVFHLKDKVIKYNFVDQTFKKLWERDNSEGPQSVMGGGWCRAFPFIESLCSV